MTSRKTAALLSGAATAFCALALGGAPAWAENEDLPKESGQYSAVGDRSGPSEIQSDEALAGRVVEEATAFAGIPYRFGGTTARGMDCSFFVRTAFDAAGVLLPRTAREMFVFGRFVEPGDLRAGDLVFFRTYARFPSHVGIYLGERLFIHASRKSRKVQIDSLDAPYFSKRYLGGRRLDGPPVDAG
ncbi:MAG: hypothetical protein A2V83_03755 [Nitrospirae bacterium RBG_16_64_22]|nr:MAG: hypothetical protein A2V83_03755 [Nitrospirae bacterium RBG_16_64_22]